MPNTRKRRNSKRNQRVQKRQVLLEKSTCPDYFNYLNHDCLSKIFKYLSIKQRLDVVTVCKRWKDAFQFFWDDVKALNFNNPSLPWKGDSKELPTAYRTNHCIERILRNCGNSLRELELGNHVNTDILQVLKEHCCNLTKLEVDVSNCTIIPRNLLLRMQSLSYLKIKGNKQHFSADLLEALTCETLAEIHLLINDAHCLTFWQISEAFLPSNTPKILAKLTKLTAITLEGFVLEPNILKVLDQKGSWITPQKNPLTYLSLANSTLIRDISCLTRFENLEHLNLNTVESVHDDFVKMISQNCRKLRYLNLGHCRRVTDNGIQNLANLSQLEELDLSSNENITDNLLRRLCHLKKLNVVDCPEVRDSGIMELIQCALNLEYLNVASTGVTKDLLHIAATITQTRRNNVQLRVMIDCNLKRHWESSAASFPLLIVDMSEQERAFLHTISLVCDHALESSSEIDDYEYSSEIPFE